MHSLFLHFLRTCQLSPCCRIFRSDNQYKMRQRGRLYDLTFCGARQSSKRPLFTAWSTGMLPGILPCFRPVTLSIPETPKTVFLSPLNSLGSSSTHKGFCSVIYFCITGNNRNKFVTNRWPGMTLGYTVNS